MASPAATAGVVVPVHGWAPYLAETLDSVLAEGPGEVVVVDDGSPDPLELHADHAPHVRLVRRDEPGGPAAARNAGVGALPGVVDLIAFCDADDAWEPGSLRRRLAALAADPGAAGAFGRAHIVGADGRPTGEAWPLPAAGRYDDVDGLYEHNPILTSSVVLRRAAAPPFDERYRHAEDWELWLRMLHGGAVLTCVDDAVVRYRRHPAGLTTDVTAMARAQRRLHEQYAALVSPATRDRALAADRRGEAAGLLRDGRPRQARALLDPGLRRTALGVPGLRALVGRRDPYARPRRG